MIQTISDRAFIALNLNQFEACNVPEVIIKNYYITCPFRRQYILRMLIRKPHGNFQIPTELEWLTPMLDRCAYYQQHYLKIKHPFCYITVRHGIVESTTDDEWHVDGFSTQITHLPEQNYVWSNMCHTEFITKQFKFPKDFNPLKHNIQLFFQDNITKSDLKYSTGSDIVCFDPYIVHRRPQIPTHLQKTMRTFIRISFTPIEIADDNNTPNPLLPIPKYNRDGIKDFRDKLLRY